MTVYKVDPELKAELDKYLPPLPEEKFQKLKAKIAKDGYDEAKPIAIWEERPNTIVDGHHRYRACRELGIDPAVVEKSFASIDDAVLYAIEGYLTGRELTAAQRVIATEHSITLEEKLNLKELARVRDNQDHQTGKFIPSSDGPSENGVSREVAEKIAEKAGTTARTVYRVHAVQEKGVPALSNMLASGEIGGEIADTFVQKIPDKGQQNAIIAAGGADAVKAAVKDIRHAEKERKIQLTKAEREAEDQRKFDEFNRTVAEKTAIANAKIDRVFGTNGDACLMPNVAQKWCNDCKWGFDIYLPAPAQPCCPYCKGDNLSKRDDDWNPREVM
jgi:ParB-like chromosome segregation protein Spo0J